MKTIPAINSSDKAKRCAFPGCGKTSERPGADGWTARFEWAPDAPELYCPEHAAVLERRAVYLEPEFPL
ncbi:MAG TPA: hypothetical protein VFE60_07035 [Roseiarcus sp.]|jgi:hypothetical protein|nr:hypothetical protein [Roseiarcus sp.]